MYISNAARCVNIRYHYINRYQIKLFRFAYISQKRAGRCFEPLSPINSFAVWKRNYVIEIAYSDVSAFIITVISFPFHSKSNVHTVVPT